MVNLDGSYSDEVVVVVDLGGGEAHRVAKLIRSLGTYSELLLPDMSRELLASDMTRGVVVVGGAESWSTQLMRAVLDAPVPVLFIGHAAAAIAEDVRQGTGVRESQEGEASLCGMAEGIGCGVHFGEGVVRLGPLDEPLFRVAVRTDDGAPFLVGCGGSVFCLAAPETVLRSSSEGAGVVSRIVQSFLRGVCGSEGDWSSDAYVERAVMQVREVVGHRRVVCGLSGGIDSSTAALLVHKAIGERLTCVFVDTGLMRKGEPEEVVRTFRDAFGVDLVHVDAAERFFGRLAEVTDPEEKRRAIGDEFVRVFEEEARRIGPVDLLLQGTTYPDVIESRVSSTHGGVRVKSHHNVGGLPEEMELGLLEPTRFLFKDEVREVAAKLGLPDTIVKRQPFPGPGLAVRVVGEVTPERVALARESDAIVAEELRRADVYGGLWQAFAVLTGARSVGVVGDERTYGETVAVRAVESEDGMEARWAEIPHGVLRRISRRILNEVPAVNRVVLDISDKPPATIEWE